jgi:hypothetical protein
VFAVPAVLILTVPAIAVVDEALPKYVVDEPELLIFIPPRILVTAPLLPILVFVVPEVLIFVNPTVVSLPNMDVSEVFAPLTPPIFIALVESDGGFVLRLTVVVLRKFKVAPLSVIVPTLSVPIVVFNPPDTLTLNAPVEDTEGVMIPPLNVSKALAVSGTVFRRYRVFAVDSVKPEPVPVSDVKKDGLKGIPL